MSLRILNINKCYGSHQALRDVSLSVSEGCFLTLLGPSGCGKSTLLRIIAGLGSPDSGHVIIDHRDVTDEPPSRRNLGFVFQNYALFRHLTVAENIEFGLKIKPRSLRPSKSEIADTVAELLKLVQLEGFGGRFPQQLSGGEQQRVALARALAVKPRYLLLDEPFSALDAKVRRELRTWLRGLQKQLLLTCILVTHDQDEAIELSDQIALMNQGGIEQVGRPSQLTLSPATPFARSFLSSVSSSRVVKSEVPL